MVFLNFYFDLFVIPPSLFMLIDSRRSRDHFPILHDHSQSFPNVSRRLAIFLLLSPYASLSIYYFSYADYDYLISPFHSHCYLSLVPYVFFSILLYVLTQVTLTE